MTVLHFLRQQIEWGVWFGNVVAGVVVAVVVTVAWKWKVKGWVNDAIRRHFERHRAIQMQRDEARHKELTEQAERHHAEHMAASAPKTRAKKAAVAKKAPAAKVAKAAKKRTR